MSYDSINDLPERVTNSASEACQGIFREAYNSAEANDNYDNDENTLFQIAWGVMTNYCSESDEDGETWVQDAENSGAARESNVSTETDTAASTAIYLDALADDETADLDGEGPWPVQGVAVPEGVVATGVAGDRTYWPANVLDAAADQLAGRKITEDFDLHEDLDQRQPTVRSIVGEVTDAFYRDGTGLMFAGEVDDPDIARQIQNERLDVSPVISRRLGEWDDEREAYRAESIEGFRDLAVVAHGAFDGNAIEPGDGEADMSAAAVRTAFAERGEERDGSEGTDDGAIHPEVRTARSGYADTLAEHVPFDSDTLTERFDVGELQAALTALRDAGTIEGADALAAPRTGGSGGSSARASGLDAGASSGSEGDSSGSSSASEDDDLDALRERRRVLANVASEDHLADLDAEIERRADGSGQ
jgi:cation transport regulator ChaB